MILSKPGNDTLYQRFVVDEDESAARRYTSKKWGAEYRTKEAIDLGPAFSDHITYREMVGD